MTRIPLRSISEHRRRAVRAGLAASVVAAAVLAAGCVTDDTATPAQSSEARQVEVATRGAPVMGFDLDATVHRFRKITDGGVQQVVARDPDDTEQIAAVRAHLREEHERFLAGDYSSPAEIHGGDMPGLQALGDAPAGSVGVSYRELSDGAELTFTTTQDELVSAVHDWFDAQLADHGDDAEEVGDHGDDHDMNH